MIRGVRLRAAAAVALAMLATAVLPASAQTGGADARASGQRSIAVREYPAKNAGRSCAQRKDARRRTYGRARGSTSPVRVQYIAWLDSLRQRCIGDRPHQSHCPQ